MLDWQRESSSSFDCRLPQPRAIQRCIICSNRSTGAAAVTWEMNLSKVIFSPFGGVSLQVGRLNWAPNVICARRGPRGTYIPNMNQIKEYRLGKTPPLIRLSGFGPKCYDQFYFYFAVSPHQNGANEPVWNFCLQKSISARTHFMKI